MAVVVEHLVDLPDNQLPDGAMALVLECTDGVGLRAAYWPMAGMGAGTVVVLPGRSEFIEKYAEVIGELGGRGFAVAALDWRGQGGSERGLSDSRKGHIDDFHLYLRDLDALLVHLARIDAPRPWYGLAHSMGGAILAYAIATGEQRFDRAVLSAPMFGICDAPTSGVASFAAAALHLIGLGGMTVPGGGAHEATAFAPFEGNPLTSDKARYERTTSVLIAGPDLAIGAPTVSWVAAALRLIREMEHPEFGLAARCPMLIVAAGNDTIVSTAACEVMGLRLRGASSITIPGARHELLMERDGIRQQFWAAFDAFIHADA